MSPPQVPNTISGLDEAAQSLSNNGSTNTHESLAREAIRNLNQIALFERDWTETREATSSVRRSLRLLREAAMAQDRNSTITSTFGDVNSTMHDELAEHPEDSSPALVRYGERENTAQDRIRRLEERARRWQATRTFASQQAAVELPETEVGEAFQRPSQLVRHIPVVDRAQERDVTQRVAASEPSQPVGSIYTARIAALQSAQELIHRGTALGVLSRTTGTALNALTALPHSVEREGRILVLDFGNSSQLGEFESMENLNIDPGLTPYTTVVHRASLTPSPRPPPPMDLVPEVEAVLRNPGILTIRRTDTRNITQSLTLKNISNLTNMEIQQEKLQIRQDIEATRLALFHVSSCLVH
jgi:hypothetical protein